MSLGSLCRCVCWPREGKSEENLKLETILHKLQDVEAQVVSLEDAINHSKENPTSRQPILREKPTPAKRPESRTSRVSFGGENNGGTVILLQ